MNWQISSIADDLPSIGCKGEDGIHSDRKTNFRTLVYNDV